MVKSPIFNQQPKKPQVSIQRIGKTISRFDEISTAIASAVEEQTAATHEIARNIELASQGTDDVSINISGVSKSVENVKSESDNMHDSASQLSHQSETLKSEVEKFLTSIRKTS